MKSFTLTAVMRVVNGDILSSIPALASSAGSQEVVGRTYRMATVDLRDPVMRSRCCHIQAIRRVRQEINK